MKKKIIIISILVIALTYLSIRYGFIAVLWLTTPKDGELTQAEKNLFIKIKKNTGATEVWREPKYHLKYPKDTTTYRIIASSINCNNDSLLLRENAQIVRLEIDQWNLHKNFYQYQVIFKCVNGKEYTYKYLR